MVSPSFQLFRSTRQGCPVSPVIFILPLEPLVCAIRANQNITGISLFEHVFKTSLHADDISQTLSNPVYLIPQLLPLINVFGNFLDTKLIGLKAIHLNHLTFPVHLSSNHIMWKTQGMKCLEINIKSPINKVFDSNGPSLLKTKTISRDGHSCHYLCGGD